MKYRLAGILALLLVLTGAFAATALDSENPKNRVHQHQTARQPDAGCSCNGKELCTHLPLVMIETGGQEIPGVPITDANGQETGFTTTPAGEEMLRAKLSVISDDAHNHHPSDTPDLESELLIRIRGNSSRYFDKKSYLLRLTQQDGSYRKAEVMGMAAHYEWALYGPYLDKSLLRNYMWYNIAGEIMDYAPNVRFCEVMIDGAYQGLYVMTETITNGDDCRLDISAPVQGTGKTGYLLRLDRGSSTPVKNIETFSNYAYRNMQKINIQYPRSGDLTETLANSIAQDFSDFEKSLYSFDYDTENYGYKHEIDVQSFVDYFILNEVTANYDAGWLSTYIYRDIGGKYRMVIWDFNSACDNYMDSTLAPQHFEMQHNVWYFMLMKDEEFTDQIIRRYRQLRQTYLSDACLDRYIDETVAYLGDAIDRNYTVWGYTLQLDLIQPAERNPRSQEAAVAQLKDFLQQRTRWMDQNIEVLRQYSHESKNKKFNH